MKTFIVFLLGIFSSMVVWATDDAKEFGCEKGAWILKVNLWPLSTLPEGFREEVKRFLKNRSEGQAENELSLGRVYGPRLREMEKRGEIRRDRVSFMARAEMSKVSLEEPGYEGIAWFTFQRVRDDITVTFPAIPNERIVSVFDKKDGSPKKIVFTQGEWWNNPTPKDCTMNVHALVE